jgi:hypothetical protein
MLGNLARAGWALLIGGVAALAGLVAVWRNGRKSERSRREAQDARDYRDTRRRMDDATGDDLGPDHVRKWLLERSRKP